MTEKLDFTLQWEVLCGYCGASEDPKQAELSIKPGSTVRFRHEIACSTCGERIEWLFQLLREHGTHTPACSKLEQLLPCDCGWDSAQEALCELIEEDDNGEGKR